MVLMAKLEVVMVKGLNYKFKMKLVLGMSTMSLKV